MLHCSSNEDSSIMEVAGVCGSLGHDTRARASFLLGGRERNLQISCSNKNQVFLTPNGCNGKRNKAGSLNAERLRKKFEQFGNEEWRRKRIGWLCKEIPVLKVGGIVRILKNQKKWIRGQEINYIVHHLLRCTHLAQAHQVYKWWGQQAGYEPDFEMSTNLANILGMQGRMARAQEIYDSLINSGHVPDASTFSALVTGYLLEGVEQSFEEAWKIYFQMKQLGGYEPPTQLKFDLFKALIKGCDKSLKWLDYADTLFQSFLEAGLCCNSEMYASLLHFHALKGNEDKVEIIFKQLKVAGFDVSPELFTSLLIVCAKTGNYRKAEHVFQELKKIVQVPDWQNYVFLIKTFAKAGYYVRALHAFHEIERLSSNLNSEIYGAIIKAMAGAGDLQLAERLLDKLSERSCQSSQSTFNSVMHMYIRKGLHPKVETLFIRMKLRNCRPNHESYNLLILSYLEIGLLTKAEEIYDKMQGNGSITRNLRTYKLMLQGYRKAEQHEKFLEVLEELVSRKLVLQSDLKHFVLAAQEQRVIV
ncbi:hypothetical protein O6H91_01G109900 [Diphasiastrum complanatum]|uniref:Uncharacterized protein n=1 Tax=Diphasiastrum complanatum TaxID=34168 RepID=A0ACC2EUQ4_DIPCM|nr:hypothetical protein O6H91_01G109900 [Diphasiastrum complanatum]